MFRSVPPLTRARRALAIASIGLAGVPASGAAGLSAQVTGHAAHGPSAGSSRDGRVPLYDNLGTHSWQVSATSDAQRYFDQGLRLFWAFNQAESMRSFREGERTDPRCAMCASPCGQAAWLMAA